YRRFLRLAEDWPNDPLRPNRTFRRVLEVSMPQRFRAPTSSPDKALARGKVQADALEAILENTYKNKWPLDQAILSPAKDPNYYKRMLRGLEEGAKDGSL
ncbi:MAG: hypothetical protein DHS80DRAFT_7890, partial [Piptocephalis tieghemiana]